MRERAIDGYAIFTFLGTINIYKYLPQVRVLGVRELQKVRAKRGHERRSERASKLEEIIEKVDSEALLAAVLVFDPLDKPREHL